MPLTNKELSDVLKLHGQDTKNFVFTNWLERKEIWDWSNQHDVHIEYEGTMYGQQDIWCIPDEQHRMWFKLRWG
jgi:hypothetical protein